MNILISIIYAPLVFVSLRYFDIQIVSLVVFFLSWIWFVIAFKKEKKNSLYPLLYIVISFCTFFLEELLLLKVIPLLISVVITSLIFISYINKKSIILYFANKFSKREISTNEKEYIENSTLFWIAISSLNIICHIFILLNGNMEFWVYYSSFGWYFIFLFGGILQFLHRKFIFLKRDTQ